MKKYYVVSHNSEFLSCNLVAENTDKDVVQTAFFEAVRKELIEDVGLNGDEASMLIMRSLCSHDDVDPCLSITNAFSATVRYGSDYETDIDTIEREVPSYHVEELCYDHEASTSPYTEVYNASYEDREHALVAAMLLAFETAQEMNEQARSEAGPENARWFAADDNNENDGYSYVLRC